MGPLSPGLVPAGGIVDAVAGSWTQQTDRADAVENDSRVVLVLDQAERMFAAELTSADRQQFIRQLEELAARHRWFRTLLVIRSDVLASRDIDATLGRHLVHPIRVPALQRNDMRAAICEPARLARIDFEDGLVERLLDDAGASTALPLLSYCLMRLAAPLAGTGGKITMARYEGSHGVRGALEERANEAVESLERKGHSSEGVLNTLERLAWVRPELAPTARAINARELDDRSREILDEFVFEKLVVKDAHDGGGAYEVAHEEFLRWSPLSRHLEAKRAEKSQLDLLEQRAAAFWTGQNTSDLLVGGVLRAARRFREQGRTSERLDSYIDASRVADRPTRVVRLTRSSLAAYIALIPVTAFLAAVVALLVNISRGGLASAVNALGLVFLVAMVWLVSRLVTRRRWRLTQYLYASQVTGEPCRPLDHVKRWLCGVIGVFVTPFTWRDHTRLTFVDKVTNTELVRSEARAARRDTPMPTETEHHLSASAPGDEYGPATLGGSNRTA